MSTSGWLLAPEWVEIGHYAPTGRGHETSVYEWMGPRGTEKRYRVLSDGAGIDLKLEGDRRDLALVMAEAIVVGALKK